jgi:antitoxin component HigA of HigAB toxin-antitoxin module
MLSARNVRRAILSAFASLLFLSQASGQESFAQDPLALVKRLVDPAPIADLSAYHAKDVDLTNMRAQVEKALIRVNGVELIEAKGQSGVVAVELAHRLGSRTLSDTYFYLSADPNWKVVAHVTPPLPPWAPERKELGYASEEKIRALLVSRGASAEQIADVLAIRKTAPLYGSDQNVTAYFEQNRARLNELRDKIMPLLKSAVETKDLVEKRPEAINQLSGANPDEISRITALLKETAALWMGNTLFDQSYAEQIGRDHPDWRYFNIAMWGFDKGALGFFWKSENAEPPSLAPDGYLIVRPLGGGWYLYRMGA